ncbi:MAG TPA: type II toxin-antitoxin system prevent-host-death family antitoxin [Thermoanaerobaculia bacterium]|nr:type II toxin-antitoxin system prevent-host-death family antitoxin [Thermoanaerobaculia bacterium]
MATESVGIRELRQNLTKYLRRVAGGESLRVSDRGRLVALLTPLPEGSEPVGRLESTGRLRRAHRDLIELGEPEARPTKLAISEALAQERSEP